MEVHRSTTESWRVTLVDTGEQTMTGGRLKRVMGYLGEEEDFCFTYGDGLSDLDIGATIGFHRQQGSLATVTAVQPAGRFGAIDVEGERVTGFEEKPRGDRSWTNGVFVLSPAVGEYIDGDGTVWEQEPMRALAAEGQMAAYRHEGFWQPMDTLRDRNHLEELWRSGRPPWRTWE
jgi:glucose-1-phosphate cytidylyltransferase